VHKIAVIKVKDLTDKTLTLATKIVNNYSFKYYNLFPII